MLWSIRYRSVCWLLRLLVRCGLDELDLEKAVLRHQLKVLRHGGGRALFTTADRAFLAASARVLSRDRWRSFLVYEALPMSPCRLPVREPVVTAPLFSPSTTCLKR